MTARKRNSKCLDSVCSFGFLYVCAVRVLLCGCVRGCIRRFPEWLPGARIANGTALCHWMQLRRYFVNQCSEFCRYKPLYCFSTSVYYCERIFRYRLSLKLLDTPSCDYRIYNYFVYPFVILFLPVSGSFS